MHYARPEGLSGTRRHMIRMDPEFRARTIFYCPGRTLPGQTTDNARANYQVMGTSGSYGGNRWLNSHNRGGLTGYLGRRIDDATEQGVPEPSATLAVGCSAGWTTSGSRRGMWGTTRGWSGGFLNGAYRRDAAYMKHLGATTGLFVDGHAEVVHPNDEQPPRWRLEDGRQDPNEWQLIDLNVRINPNPASHLPRLRPGDTVGPED